jgi:hypothetical protein
MAASTACAWEIWNLASARACGAGWTKESITASRSNPESSHLQRISGFPDGSKWR